MKTFETIKQEILRRSRLRLSKTRDMERQIATNRLQSNRLLQCGVSADTADMMFTPHNTLSTEPYKETLENRGYIPAWSLSALLSTMPDLEHCFSLWKFEEDDTYAADATMVNPDFRVDANDPIEACVGLIEILHANGYKLNEQ